MDNHINVQVSIPADDDGYVRQSCPYCGREFKAPIEDEELASVERCPYCGLQGDQWFTAEQMEQFQAQAMAALMPQLDDDLRKMARKLERSSAGLLKMDVRGNDVEVPVITPEAPDMKAVSSPCCQANLKIEDDWSGVTFCSRCGSEYQLNDSN